MHPVKAWLVVRQRRFIWLSEETGINESRLHHYVSGERKLKENHAALIAKAIEMPIAFVLGRNQILTLGLGTAPFREDDPHERGAAMRTKEEILDTIDSLGGELYRSEIQVNAEKGLDRAAPGANFIEAMKPFAEAMLDLRDLLVGLTEGEEGQIIRQYIAGQLQLQKKDADWRATIVSRIISEIRRAGQEAGARGKDDAKPMEGAPHGDGREDTPPSEEGPGS